jgi:hypothetical protein
MHPRTGSHLVDVHNLCLAGWQDHSIRGEREWIFIWQFIGGDPPKPPRVSVWPPFRGLPQATCSANDFISSIYLTYASFGSRSSKSEI